VLLCRIIGPVLLVRAVSIVLDRRHFDAMVAGLEHEVTTVAFSIVPIALLMACLGLAATYTDTSSPAALLIHVIIWAGMLKTSALILFPRVLAAKARLLLRAGFLNVVLAVCCGVGGYFTWFGWLATR
jgi:hypothetical protein